MKLFVSLTKKLKNTFSANSSSWIPKTAKLPKCKATCRSWITSRDSAIEETILQWMSSKLKCEGCRRITWTIYTHSTIKVRWLDSCKRTWKLSRLKGAISMIRRWSWIARKRIVWSSLDQEEQLRSVLLKNGNLSYNCCQSPSSSTRKSDKSSPKTS